MFFSGGCRCNVRSAQNYATLGNRNRKFKVPQFATLQRNRPSEMRLQACNIGSAQCHASCSSACHFTRKVVYPKASPYTPSQPCSLPTCLSSSSVAPINYQWKSNLNGFYLAEPSSSKTESSNDGRRDGNTPPKEEVISESKKNATGLTNNRDELADLQRKKKSSLSLLSPEKERKHDQESNVKNLPRSEEDAMSKSSQGTEINRFPSRYCQSSLKQKNENVSSDIEYSLYSNSQDGDFSTPTSTPLSIDRHKFPQDFVKQQSSSMKDSGTINILKPNS